MNGIGVPLSIIHHPSRQELIQQLRVFSLEKEKLEELGKGDSVPVPKNLGTHGSIIEVGEVNGVLVVQADTIRGQADDRMLTAHPGVLENNMVSGLTAKTDGSFPERKGLPRSAINYL
jgi:hypothetical protein